MHLNQWSFQKLNPCPIIGFVLFSMPLPSFISILSLFRSPSHEDLLTSDTPLSHGLKTVSRVFILYSSKNQSEQCSPYHKWPLLQCLIKWVQVRLRLNQLLPLRVSLSPISPLTRFAPRGINLRERNLQVIKEQDVQQTACDIFTSPTGYHRWSLVGCMEVNHCIR